MTVTRKTFLLAYCICAATAVPITCPASTTTISAGALGTRSIHIDVSQAWSSTPRGYYGMSCNMQSGSSDLTFFDATFADGTVRYGIPCNGTVTATASMVSSQQGQFWANVILYTREPAPAYVTISSGKMNSDRSWDSEDILSVVSPAYVCSADVTNNIDLGDITKGKRVQVVSVTGKTEHTSIKLQPDTVSDNNGVLHEQGGEGLVNYYFEADNAGGRWDNNAFTATKSKGITLIIPPPASIQPGTYTGTVTSTISCE